VITLFNLIYVTSNIPLAITDSNLHYIFHKVIPPIIYTSRQELFQYDLLTVYLSPNFIHIKFSLCILTSQTPNFQELSRTVLCFL